VTSISTTAQAIIAIVLAVRLISVPAPRTVPSL
jgi:hypothetical protein